MLQLQLAGEGWNTCDGAPAKPKWMRWRTYEREYECPESAAEKANEEFAVRAARL
jgi:rubredoxin